jgi:hypothetical protein
LNLLTRAEPSRNREQMMSNAGTITLAGAVQPQPPSQQFQAKVIYDFVTDPNLVPQIVGYRRAKGFTIVSVYEQPDIEANFVTGFQTNGFPQDTSLAIPPQTKTWVVVSRA